MPSVRGQPPLPSKKDRITYIRSRFFGLQVNSCPLWRSVPTQDSPKLMCHRLNRQARQVQRYPWVEPLFEHRHIQPFIHDTKITISENGVESHFLVFCQNHSHLPLNTAVAGFWKGEILVMRCAKNREGVVNMRSDDAEKVDLVISQFITRFKQATPFHFPSNLKFQI